MAKKINIWFPFNVEKYLSDINVQLMSIEEEGVYIRLLAICWKENGIPNDKFKLQRLCKGVQIEAIENVMKLFILKGEDQSKLTHKRLEQEKTKASGISVIKSEAGKEGAKKRWHVPSVCHDSAIDLPMAKNSQSQLQSQLQVESKAPTHAQVKECFFMSRKIGWSDTRCVVEATNFFDHYESIGWMVNNQPIKNWQARARKWINNEKEFNDSVKISSQGQALPNGNDVAKKYA